MSSLKMVLDYRDIIEKLNYVIKKYLSNSNMLQITGYWL